MSQGSPGTNFPKVNIFLNKFFVVASSPLTRFKFKKNEKIVGGASKENKVTLENVEILTSKYSSISISIPNSSCAVAKWLARSGMVLVVFHPWFTSPEF